GVEDVPGKYSGLDALGKFNFLLSAEQRGASDAVEIDPDQVRCWALRVEIRLKGGVCFHGNLRGGHQVPSCNGSSGRLAPGVRESARRCTCLAIGVPEASIVATPRGRIPFPDSRPNDERVGGEVPSPQDHSDTSQVGGRLTRSAPGLVALEERHTSRRTVNGPSATLRTAIMAPKRPVATRTPRARRRSTTSSISGSACSGRAAAVKEGRRPLRVLP